ncbi:MAG: universal stress protein [Myxococcales bacterium]|jgi:nucleotide-binding universal stress UspA family protein
MATTQSIKHILVPVDGSQSACNAAAYAGTLARAFGAELTLLHVFNAPAVTAMGLVALARADLQRAQQEVSRGAFDKARAAVGEGLTIHERTELGDPAAEVLSILRTGGADQVVMGTRGLSPMQEILLGSVSERVLAHAPCPVTLVH